jgi:hypothetical protein
LSFPRVVFSPNQFSPCGELLEVAARHQTGIPGEDARRETPSCVHGLLRRRAFLCRRRVFGNDAPVGREVRVVSEQRMELRRPGCFGERLQPETKRRPGDRGRRGRKGREGG